MNFPVRRPTVKLIIVFIAALLFTMVGWHQSESTLSPEQMHENENKLLAELVTLKLEIESARSAIESQDNLMQQNLREKAIQERELAQIRVDLAASSKELGKWLEFSYRYGYASVLDVLVSSSDFNDFINRSVLLWAIIDRQSEVLEHNRFLKNQSEESLRNIDAINNTITRNLAQLESNLAQLKRSEDELARFLAELKKQSVELEVRLSALSQQWAEVTGLTSGIIHRLSTLPVEEFTPDKIKLSFGGMQLEYSDETINQAVKKVNLNSSSHVTVSIKTERITISGSTGSRGVNFEAKGNFEITPDKKKIVFVPESITVDHNTLEGYMLKTILNNSNLTWDITRYYPGLSITSLSNSNEIIKISLKY